MEQSPLKVLIVGGGIGGLMLAILLERMGINYLILEKTTSYKPLGSYIMLISQVFSLFEQLGMLEEIESISKNIMSTVHLDEDFKRIGGFQGRFFLSR